MSKSVIATGGLSDPWGDPAEPDGNSVTFYLLIPTPKGKVLTNEEAGKALAWWDRVRRMTPR